MRDTVLYEISEHNEGLAFSSSITEAMVYAEAEIEALEETIDSINRLKPQCDKTDYALAVSIGALCGVFDIFLVGAPGESSAADVVDKWAANCIMGFARLCGWKDDGSKSLASAVSYLENKFKVPYDQTGAGGAGRYVFNLNPSNHHFKSLAHNPTLLGLFFSVLDQFCNQSHFVTEGEIVALQEASNTFVLRGKSLPGKLLCGFINWFGHLLSDASGASSSKGRGMGIPSPFWAWVNDVIVIKSKLGIAASEFDKSVNELAVEIFKEGYDARFQTAQLVPVMINETIVRIMYSIRRLIKYYSETEKNQRTYKDIWKSCQPFSNATVKRMLTVAHGSFCVIDLGDAIIRSLYAGGGSFNVAEFAMRLNLIGVGRFTVSLYGEVQRGITKFRVKEEAAFAAREKKIVQNYVEGLKQLSKLYDDRGLISFVDDLQKSNMYIDAFQKSVQLAKLRNVPDQNIMKSKEDFDLYFRGGQR